MKADKTYEIMVIFDCEAEEAERQVILDGFQTGIQELNGEITHTDVWGMRPFAYEIDHKHEGFYIVMEFKASGDVNQLDRPMRLSDVVVRQKIVLISDEEIARRDELRTNGQSTFATSKTSKPKPSFVPPTVGDAQTSKKETSENKEEIKAEAKEETQEIKEKTEEKEEIKEEIKEEAKDA